MFARIAGIFLMIFGAVGMVVPFLPSIIPLVAGFCLFTTGSLPPFLSFPRCAFTVDWDWVRQEILKKERLADMAAGQTKDAINKTLDQCLKKARTLIRPKVTTVRKKIAAITDGGVRLEGGTLFSGAKLASYLTGASDAYVFVATIGCGIEKTATERMAAGESLEGYLFDRIGSFAAESLAENIEMKLRKHCEAREESVSMRFSPGYCDWPVEEQRVMDKLIGFSKAGISLTEGCMMVPRKSISAVLGIGPIHVFPRTGSPCMICNKRDCSYRRD
jgi:hypothetical protein